MIRILRKIKSLKINKKFVTVFSFFTVGFISLNLLENYTRRIFNYYKQDLETNLETLIDKDIVLGEFSHLSFFGFSITNTKVIDENSNEIELEAQNINFRIMPMRSILNWKWAVQINPNNLNISLVENSLDDIFRNYSQKEEVSFFKYELHFNLKNKVIINLPDSGIVTDLVGELVYDSNNKQFFGFLNSFFRERGHLRIKFNTKFNQQILSFKLSTKNLDLTRINYEVLGRDIVINDGNFNSNISFFRSSDKIRCSGGISLNNFQMNSSQITEDINTDYLGFRCKGNNLIVKTNNLTYGTLISDLNLDIPLRNYSNNILLDGVIGYFNSSNPEIKISGLLPFWINDQGFNFGDLEVEFNLNRTQLSNLNFFRNSGIRGYITAKGFITGDLTNPKTFIDFDIEYPHYKGIRIREIFDGKITNEGEGYILTMNNRSSPIPSFLSIKFDEKLRMNNLEFSRLFDSKIGSLIIEKKDDFFVWAATNFSFNEIELSLRDNEFDSVNGSIDGSGIISSDQSYVDGRFSLILGEYKNIKLANSIFEFAIDNNLFDINASLYPVDGGEIDIAYKSNDNNLVNLNFKDISAKWTALTTFDVLNLNNNIIISTGNFNDLQNVQLSTEEKSLDEQLTLINQLSVEDDISPSKVRLNNYLDKLEGRYNATIEIFGNDISNYFITADLKGYLNEINSLENYESNFSVNVEGGLFRNKGTLTIEGLPLSISNLFFDKPKDFKGSLDVKLNYDLNEKEFISFISSNNTSINGYELDLDKTQIDYEDSLFNLDLSLMLNKSGNPIQIVGLIPIDLKNQLNVRLNGDERILDLLGNLTNDNFTFNSGDANLRMIISGNLDKPIANGFFFLRDGNLQVFDNSLKDINSTIIFDFDQLDIIDFSAKNNDSGSLFLSGALPFYNKSEENTYINFITSDFRLIGKNFDFIFNSNIKVNNSFLSPLIEGEITLSNGYFDFKGNNKEDNTYTNTKQQNDLNTLWPELSWNKKEEIEIITNESILNRNLVNEKFPIFLDNISFQNIELILGPEFRVGYGNILQAYLYTEKELQINGNVQDNLNARGQINILRARVNLYTTPFKLDNNSDNFLVFASRAGINPFISFSLISKVPDSIIPIIENNNDSNFSGGNNIIANENSFGSLGIGNTRFIRIEASYSGFLDQLTFEDENQKILLRSTPAYSRSQIIGLIGGNSANLINRTLISQLYGFNNFSDRIQLSLYPALIENNESINNLFSGDTLDLEDASYESSDNSSSQAWVAEFGLDITDKINFAVQTTPDRDDIPPLGILTFQANPNLEILSSFDSNGDWNAQLQLFLRY